MRICATLLLAWWASLLSGATPVDLTKLDRRIAKEPNYTCKDPLYGLIVFGPEAKTKVWMVLDKSESDADAHDVLYVDLNGDGDLTEKGERFVGSTSGQTTRFELPDFTDPNDGAKHSEFRLRVTLGQRRTYMLSLLWRGKHKLGGGYPEEPGPDGYMHFGPSVKEAPILWANGDGPFRFQRWYSGEFPIGNSADLKVFLGQEGVGRHAFCAFQRHVLPESEPVLATLIYEDKAGNQQKKDFKLKERC